VDYPGAIAALEQALRFGIHPSLEGIRALTDALGRPQDAFAVVQVTGTNGKSSVTRLVEAILGAEGLSAGAYTSPHLESYTERIELAGVPCSEEDFAQVVGRAIEAAAGAAGGVTRFTEFELLTASALLLFRERGVDIACLEVGMGGRWDSTSVADPAVAVVTGVGVDHTERLGSSIEEIAADKAHIIKPGASVVLGPGTAPVVGIFLARAGAFGLHPRFVAAREETTPVAEDLTVRYSVLRSPNTPGGRLTLHVRGIHGDYDRLDVTAPSYQAPNVATAIAAAECALGRALHPAALRRALASMTFPGRFEVIETDPPLVIDGAHNPQAARALATAVREAWPPPSTGPCVVLGVLTDKDAEGIAGELGPVAASFVATQPGSPRARPAADLAAAIRRAGVTRVEEVPDLAQALRRARVLGGASGVLVTGSLYTAGQARALLRSG